MNDSLRRLIRSLARAEASLLTTKFVAPCRPGGRLRVRVEGLIHTFRPKPRDFEGWGIFQPIDEREAALIEEAELPMIAAYCRLLKPLRLRLCYALDGQTWLAYPADESDARRRWGIARPIAVHLVTGGAPFEPIVARGDGSALWFEEADRRADPLLAEQMRRALREAVTPDALRISGLTPEMRVAYELAARRNAGFASYFARRRDEKRLSEALRLAGGALRGVRDLGQHWIVEWTARDGQFHTSAIDKRDLTVISAGICLSGRDRDFDLQSLVGVMEEWNRGDW